MSALPQHIFASHKASLDNFLAVQGAVLNGFEKLIDLNIKAMKASFDDVSEKSREALQVQDAQQALAFSAGLLQPNAEQVATWSKNVYDVMSGVQIDVTKLTEAQFEQFQQQVANAVEQLTKNAPAGSEGAVAMLKSSLASANSAYDAVAKSARQAAQAAESNLAAASDATIKAARDADVRASNASSRKA